MAEDNDKILFFYIIMNEMEDAEEASDRVVPPEDVARDMKDYYNSRYVKGGIKSSEIVTELMGKYPEFKVISVLKHNHNVSDFLHRN